MGQITHINPCKLSLPLRRRAGFALFLALVGLLALGSCGSLGARADDAQAALVTQRGQLAFANCAGCHSLDPNEGHMEGPNLNGIFGRPVASAPGYVYSDSLRAVDGVWNEDRLNRYIARPKFIAPDNKMRYAGLLSPRIRGDLIAWLKTNPATFTTAVREAIATSDLARGKKIGKRCQACHNAAPGAPAKIGPNLWGVVGRDVGSFPGFDYSDHLEMWPGVWTPEALYAFFTETKGFRQGTHLAFRRLLKTDADRTAVLSWLMTLCATTYAEADTRAVGSGAGGAPPVAGMDTCPTGDD